MNIECIKHADNKPNMEEFEKITRPVIEWLNKNGCPHDLIRIDCVGAELLSLEIGYSLETTD